MTTRKSGRPKGASRLNPDDEIALAKMADLILATPDMKPTTAMHRIGINNETVEHRLRRKWNANGKGHLVAARQRQQQRPRYTSGEIAMSINKLPPDEIRRINEAIRLAKIVTGQINLSEVQEIAKKYKSAAVTIGEAMRNLENSGLKYAVGFARKSSNTNLAATLRGEDILKVAPLGSTLPSRKD